jgi:SWIM zinc finger
MTQQQFEKRKERAENEVFVISQTEEGYRVYSPAYPTKSYIVSGSPEVPACTCPDFESHQNDPQWRCKHILAVLDNLHKSGSCAPPASSYEDAERAAIQGGEAQPKNSVASSNGTPHMLIKRSVSPDGRIDSLSIEFSWPVEETPREEIKERAEKILDLQAEVIETFLNRNPNGKTDKAPRNGNNGAVPAQMLEIAGMNGKWGRRLFLTIQANGDSLKLFGSKKELADAITIAGFPSFAANIAEGVRLNLPCLVTTKPSGDGRYTNIEKVLPMPMPQPQRGWRQ